jgi:Ca2+-binding RTX toxin-like protein
MTWTTSSFSKIFVIGGDGNDTININETASTSPVVVNAGNGTDTIHVGGGDYDTNIDAPVTVNGDAVPIRS